MNNAILTVMKEKSTERTCDLYFRLQTCRKIRGLGCVTSAQVIHATLPTHFPAMHSLCLRHFHSPTTFTKLSSFITQNIICSRTTQNFDMVLFKQAINFLYATLKLRLLLSSLTSYSSLHFFSNGNFALVLIEWPIEEEGNV